MTRVEGKINAKGQTFEGYNFFLSKKKFRKGFPRAHSIGELTEKVPKRLSLIEENKQRQGIYLSEFKFLNFQKLQIGEDRDAVDL